LRVVGLPPRSFEILFVMEPWDHSTQGGGLIRRGIARAQQIRQ